MDFNVITGGTGALSGAASGAMMGSTFGPVGTAIGGFAGGLLGLAGGFGKKQKVPEFNAAKYARNYLERFGGFNQQQGMVEANANTLNRQVMSELISQGVDPVAARQIAMQKKNEFRSGAMGNLIDSAFAREGELTQQLLPKQIEREEDAASLRNMQAIQFNQDLSQGINNIFSSVNTLAGDPLGSGQSLIDLLKKWRLEHPKKEENSDGLI